MSVGARRIWSGGLGVLLWLSGTAFAQYYHERPAQQLPTGQTAGTFVFSYTNEVAFSQEPSFPVTILLNDAAHKMVVEQPVKDGWSFTISADLAPGSYEISARENSAGRAVYWPQWGERFFIDAKGMATFLSPDAPLVFQKKIELLSPDPKGVETVSEVRPTLKWLPLDGAATYQVHWVAIGPNQVVDRAKSGFAQTDGTEYRFEEDVAPNRRYEWTVAAFGPKRNALGFSASTNFFTPGGKQAFDALEKPVSPQAGSPYFGVVLMPVHPDEGVSGIFVLSVLPGSPALKAGIRPDDVLTTFNGQDLAGVSQAKFIDLVKAVPIGTTVTIDFQRRAEKGSTQATIEARP